MQYGIYVPNLGGYGKARDLIELAQCADAAGWDGFFIWDVLRGGGRPVADAQITLGAVASSTRNVRFGALVTPLARRRPWKFAREITTLAELSDGRVVLGCSVGESHDFAFPGELQMAPERAARLVDSIELIRQMLSGAPLEWTQSGTTARALGTPPTTISLEPFVPAPAPPIPFWGGASVQRQQDQRLGPFKRAAQLLDGLFPVAHPYDSTQPITLEEFARAVQYAFEGEQPPDGFDLIAAGPSLTGNERACDPSSYASEGATWWLEVFPNDMNVIEIIRLVDAGPPAG